MQRATLYLMVGYPGSGKTTVSLLIHELTGAVHIWADHERRLMFGTPTHSKAESRQLYDHLNALVAAMLAKGKSVIFDTNFNFRSDRDMMRQLAKTHTAVCKLIWVQADKTLAFERASIDTHLQPTRVLGDFQKDAFDRMIQNLEPPTDDEQPIILDGTVITREYVADKLGLIV